MKYEDTWDLETIFPGGTKSSELQEKMAKIQAEMNTYEKLLNTLDNEEEIPLETFLLLLQQQETIGKGLGQSATFIRMWHDAYMNDEHANVVMGQVMKINSEMQKLSNTFTKKLVAISNNNWEALLFNEAVQPIDFRLNEMRDQGKRLLSEADEIGR